MTNVGEVNVKLGLNSDEFVKAWSDADDKMKELEQNLKKSKREFQEVSLAMVGTKNPSKELVNTFNELKNKLKEDQNAFEKFNNGLKKLDGGLTQGKTGVNLLQGALAKLATGGAIIALTKQFIDFSKQSVEAFRVQERALASLDNALYNAGVYTQEYASHLRDLSSEIQSYSNYGDEAVQKAVALGQSFSGNIKLTDELIKAVVDYAAATEQDLSSAFTLVGKSIGTSTNALARYGVKLDDNMTKEQKMEVITATLSQRFNGSAQTMADSSVQLKNAMGDLSEVMGQILDPAVQRTEGFFTKLAKRLTGVLDQLRIYNAEIGKLNSTELEKRLQQTQKAIAFREKHTTKYSAEGQKYIEKLKADEKAIKTQLEAIKKANATRAQASKTSYKPITSNVSQNSNKSTKTVQDKALDEYKKYIEQYQKLTNDYQATLQARQYVENTLHIDPVKQQAEYDQALNIYQNYFSKMREIALSGAKNKAELQKLEEENLARELQEIQITKALETQRKLYDIQKGYQEQSQQISMENDLSSGFFGGLFGDAYTQKLELEKWYQTERQRIIKESNGDIEAQNKAFGDLETLRNQKIAQDNLNTWQQYGNDVSSILSSSFSDIISGNETFSDALKALMSNLYQQLIKMALNAAMKEIEIEQMKQAMLKALRAAGSFFGGIGGAIGGLVSSAVSSGGGGMMYQADPMLPMYHSGGVVPGTKEQLALVKGGERVLNPAEKAAYSSGEEENAQGGVNNIMMFNIKAWDGKDVIQTLKANSQTINQIVSSGIKNNNQGLRTTVQNI